MENLNALFASFGATDYILSFLIGFLGFFWIFSILWVVKDISARSYNLFFQLFSILLVVCLTPIFGLPIYFLIRPLKYKDEAGMSAEMSILSTIQCKDCSNINGTDFENCIYCGKKLKVTCKECKNEFSHEWDYCNKCGAPNLIVEDKAN